MGIFLFLFVWLVQAATVGTDEYMLVNLSLRTIGNDILIIEQSRVIAAVGSCRFLPIMVVPFLRFINFPSHDFVELGYVAHVFRNLIEPLNEILGWKVSELCWLVHGRIVLCSSNRVSVGYGLLRLQGRISGGRGRKLWRGGYAVAEEVVIDLLLSSFIEMCVNGYG